MEARAVAKHVRLSPKKTRPIMENLKGKDVPDALEYLRYLPKGCAMQLAKVIKSAASNAIQVVGAGELKMGDLFVKDARIDPGPTMKRWRPRAYGRAARIRKRTSHVTIVVAEHEKE
ncbi:MAG: 50S ribosomal protein L22 [bacterium]